MRADEAFFVVGTKVRRRDVVHRGERLTHACAGMTKVDGMLLMGRSRSWRGIFRAGQEGARARCGSSFRDLAGLFDN
jgi:hypothetical protein